MTTTSTHPLQSEASTSNGKPTPITPFELVRSTLEKVNDGENVNEAEDDDEESRLRNVFPVVARVATTAKKSQRKSASVSIDPDPLSVVPWRIRKNLMSYRLYFWGLLLLLFVLTVTVPRTYLYESRPPYNAIFSEWIFGIVCVVLCVVTHYFVAGSDPGYLDLAEALQLEAEYAQHRDEVESTLQKRSSTSVLTSVGGVVGTYSVVKRSNAGVSTATIGKSSDLESNAPSDAKYSQLKPRSALRGSASSSSSSGARGMGAGLAASVGRFMGIASPSVIKQRSSGMAKSKTGVSTTTTTTRDGVETRVEEDTAEGNTETDDGDDEEVGGEHQYEAEEPEEEEEEDDDEDGSIVRDEDDEHLDELASGVPADRLPVRAKYCRFSKRVVATYDHYCHFLNTSIGERNRGRFWFFLMWCTLALSWALSVAHSGFHDTVKHDWLGYNAQALVAAIFLWVTMAFVGLLFLLHTFLMMANMTTHEFIRADRVSYLTSTRDFDLPFSTGLWGNIKFYFMSDALVARIVAKLTGVKTPWKPHVWIRPDRLAIDRDSTNVWANLWENKYWSCC